jgi:hypothetical protein
MEIPKLRPERIFDRIDMKQVIAEKIAQMGVVRVEEEPQPAAIYYFRTKEEPEDLIA